jgi:hypothetical protein
MQDVDMQYNDEVNEINEDNEITTPVSRPSYESATLGDLKQRVKNADPNNGRCLVTNFSDSWSVNFCHCIARKFMKNNDLVSVY